MVGSSSSTASILSGIYNQNSRELATSLSKLASGKRIMNPSDDFAGYMRARNIQSDVSRYELITQDLAVAKGTTEYAKEVGNTIVEDLKKMEELANLWAGTSDTEEKAAYDAEYDQVVSRINSTITNSYYSNTQVYAAALLENVQLNPDSTAQRLEVSATTITTTAALTNIGNALTTMSAAVTSAQTYAAEMNGFDEAIQHHLDLTNTIINSKEATISAIVDVDEAKEMSRLTDLQVRQQAAVAMMAQANVSQQGLMRLYL